MKNPKITLADVAERAGMSPATASRALRGLSVHPKHRGKAEAAALELGYVLNEAARSLRSVRTMTVGMVFHDLTSLLGTELIGAMSAGLDELGYSVFVATGRGRNDHVDKLVHRFLQRRVDALVCVHCNGDGAALEGYAASGIPVLALITKDGGYSHLPMVFPSADKAAKDCIDSLRKHGHQRGVMIAPDRPIPAFDNMQAIAKSKKLKLDVIRPPSTGFDAAAWLKDWKKNANRPTAVITLYADAVRLLDAAKAAKISVPKDLSVAALRDRSPPGAATPVALSMIHLNPAPMAGVASDVLKAWLVDGESLTADRQVEIGSWVERDSTGPCPA